MCNLRTFLVVLFIGSSFSYKVVTQEPESKVILSHVVFRHGSRTPIAFYPTDPYKDTATLIPGELTKSGQLTAYKIGEALRKRYRNFLGDFYYKNLATAYTSSSSRTQCSLQCFLTGLFPPKPWQAFKPELNWQPISYEVLPKENDKFLGVNFYCLDKNSIFNVTTNTESPEVKALYKYLSKYSGWEVKNSSQVFFIRDIIETELALGWKQPDWVMRIWPEPLNSASKQFYHDLIGQKLRIGAGHLVRKITNDSLQKINRTLNPEELKLFIYSGHDLNLIFLLGALEAFDGQPPNYSAYIILELHEVDEVYGFKVFYQNYETDEPKPLKILNYGFFCPIDVFIEKTKWLYVPEPTC